MRIIIVDAAAADEVKRTLIEVITNAPCVDGISMKMLKIDY